MTNTLPPPAGPPVPPPGTGPVGRRPQVDWSALTRLDWMGPVRVSALILGVAGALAVLLGLGLRPAIPGLHWSLRTTLVFFGWLWTSAFGADLTARANIAGAHAHAGVGTFALTITLISLAAGGWLFRRYTAGLVRPSSIVWFAVRTAVLTAIPPTILSWVLYARLGDVLHLAGRDLAAVVGTGGNVDLGGLKVGFSSVGSFFGPLLLTLATLLAITLTRRGLFTGVLEQVRTFLAGPVIGAGILLAVLLPAGLGAALVLYLFQLGQHGGAHLTWHEWMNLAALAIAYAPNLALWELGLGSGAKIHAAASTSLGNASVSRDSGLKYWAASDTGVNHGVWFAVVLTPLVLAATAYLLVRLARRDGAAEQRKHLATWLLSLPVVLPIAYHVASLHAHARASDLKDISGGAGDTIGTLAGELGAFANTISGSAVAGPGALAVFLVFVYAAVVCVLVGLATGILTKDSLTGLRSKLSYSPATAAAPVPGGPGPSGPPPSAHDHPATYGGHRPGDVVNGWRWTGAEWIPADPQ